MANIIQTVLIRTDLFGDCTGLIAAQVAHIHAQVLMLDKAPKHTGELDFNSWKMSPYLFVKKVPNLEVLNYFMDKADKSNVQCELWKDTVYVKASQTLQIVVENCPVGISLGPCESDRIKAVIGDLPLL